MSTNPRKEEKIRVWGCACATPPKRIHPLAGDVGSRWRSSSPVGYANSLMSCPRRPVVGSFLNGAPARTPFSSLITQVASVRWRLFFFPFFLFFPCATFMGDLLCSVFSSGSIRASIEQRSGFSFYFFFFGNEKRARERRVMEDSPLSAFLNDIICTGGGL